MFIFKYNKAYRMPPFFGAPDFDPDFEVRVNDVTSITFTITTNGYQLADYLPKGFKLLRPELIIGFCQLRGVEFLYAGAYNLIQIAVPARFSGRSDELEGTFPLVIWENSTRPILGGREEDGQPKIFADIQDLHNLQGKYFTNASYEGNTFLDLELNNPQLVDENTLEQIKAGSENYNIFGFRYIPKVGAPGADLMQPILYPQSMYVESAWIGKGTVQWTKLSENYRYVDPANRITDGISQYEIIKALANLPIRSIAPTTMVKGSLIMRPHISRVLK